MKTPIMSSPAQERLMLKQYHVDTWTVREQLCLTSAVLRNGDQNWPAVSRTLRILSTEVNRPPDWYSTKNCALQYARLLEKVDTPKRKREKGDLNANETPGEAVMKMLTKQRLEELENLVNEERMLFSQLKKEIELLETNQLDHKLDDVWDEIVREEQKEEEEEKKYQMWLKEREEKIIAINQALKQQGSKGGFAYKRRGIGQVKDATDPDSAPQRDGSDVSQEAATFLDQSVGDIKTEEPDMSPLPSSPFNPTLADTPSQSSDSMLGPAGIDKDLSTSVAIVHAEAMTVQEQVPPAGGTEWPSAVGHNCFREADGLKGERKEMSVSIKEELLEKGGIKEATVSDSVERKIHEGPVMKEEPAAVADIDVPDVLNHEVLAESGCDQSLQEDDHEEINEGSVESDRKREEVSSVGEESDLPSCEDESSVVEGKMNKKFDSEMAWEVDTQEEGVGRSSQVSAAEEEMWSEKFFKNSEEHSVESEPVSESDQAESVRKDGNMHIADAGELHTVEQKKRGPKKKNVLVKKDLDDKHLDEEKEKVIKCHLFRETAYSKLEDRHIDESNYDLKKVDIDEDSEDKELKSIEGHHMDFEEDNSVDSCDTRDSTSRDMFSTHGSKRKLSAAESGGLPSPIISESSPSSPASTHFGDDAESEKAHKQWKRSVMIVWNDIASHKNASIFLRPVTDDKLPGYSSIILRPMDLHTIKRNVETGNIRMTAEFHRDLMLMFLNAKMYNKRDHDVYKMTTEMFHDAMNTLEEFVNTQMLAKVLDTPQKHLRRETRDSLSKRGFEEDTKKKKEEDKVPKRIKT